MNQCLSASPCPPNPWNQTSASLLQLFSPPQLLCSPYPKRAALLHPSTQNSRLPLDPDPPHPPAPLLGRLPTPQHASAAERGPPTQCSKRRCPGLPPSTSCSLPVSCTQYRSHWSRRERLQCLATNMGNFLQEQALQRVGASAVPRVLSACTTSRTSLCSWSPKLLSAILPLPRNSLPSFFSSQGFSHSVPFIVHSSSNPFHFMLHLPPSSNCVAAWQQITLYPPNSYFSAQLASRQALLSHTLPRGHECGIFSFSIETSSWHANSL